MKCLHRTKKKESRTTCQSQALPFYLLGPRLHNQSSQPNRRAGKIQGHPRPVASVARPEGPGHALQRGRRRPEQLAKEPRLLRVTGSHRFSEMHYIQQQKLDSEVVS